MSVVIPLSSLSSAAGVVANEGAASSTVGRSKAGAEGLTLLAATLQGGGP